MSDRGRITERELAEAERRYLAGPGPVPPTRPSPTGPLYEPQGLRGSVTDSYRLFAGLVPFALGFLSLLVVPLGSGFLVGALFGDTAGVVVTVIAALLYWPLGFGFMVWAGERL